MRSPTQTPFVAVFQNELLLNSRRIAPYVLMILFTAHAVLWWGWGPAVRLGWATNSDYYIVRNLLGFSFLLGLPIFNAVIMGDPILRDFRNGVDPLIFSKPVGRHTYLFGKFLGSFFALMCCQAAFVLTLIVLQAFRTSQMVVQPVRVFPYFKHFIFFVVISHLFLAAIYFTVGTLTRNTKIVYGLAVCFYPLYISYQIFLLKNLPTRFWSLLDPMLLNSTLAGGGFLHSADFLNRYVVTYTRDMIANRAIMMLFAATCLIFAYKRFVISEPVVRETFSWLQLTTPVDNVYHDAASVQTVPDDHLEERIAREKVKLPSIGRVNEGTGANRRKLFAAIGIELRLLRAERSLVVLVPLAILLSFLALPLSATGSERSLSADYATGVVGGVLLFFLGMIVFYVGEAVQRDREVRIEPVLWTTPVPNHVFLLSKFLVTVLLMAALIILTAVTAITTQLARGHGPVDISAYLLIYSVILLPSIVFIAAIAITLNVLLRDKYVAYAASIGLSGGLFYLYMQGYNHWLYNPLLYNLWSYDGLTGAGSRRILIHRIYSVALAALFLALAHFGCRRSSPKGMRINGRFSGRAGALLATLIAAAIAIVSGIAVSG